MATLLRPGFLFEGKYEVLSLIASGGGAQVYLAIRTTDDSEVALKILRPDLNLDEGPVGAGIRRRFVREGRLAAQLRSPYTAYFIDQGRTPEGDLYIVSDYVEGESLDQTLTVSALDSARVAGIAQQVLQSLAEAHDAGVLHLNLKPSNIILCDDEEGADRIKVLDYGTSLVFADAGTAVTQVAMSGVLVGDVSYMSPERISGQPLSPSSDLYSLGLVLHEMLTGEHPIRDSRGLQVVISRQLDMSSFELPDHVDVPSGFRRLVNKMLRKGAYERFQSATKALSALSTASHKVGRQTLRSMEDMLSAADAPLLSDWDRAERDSTRESPRPLDGADAALAPDTPHPGIKRELLTPRLTPATVRSGPKIETILGMAEGGYQASAELAELASGLGMLAKPGRLPEDEESTTVYDPLADDLFDAEGTDAWHTPPPEEPTREIGEHTLSFDDEDTVGTDWDMEETLASPRSSPGRAESRTAEYSEPPAALESSPRLRVPSSPGSPRYKSPASAQAYRPPEPLEEGLPDPASLFVPSDNEDTRDVGPIIDLLRESQARLHPVTSMGSASVDTADEVVFELEDEEGLGLPDPSGADELDVSNATVDLMSADIEVQEEPVVEHKPVSPRSVAVEAEDAWPQRNESPLRPLPESATVNDDDDDAEFPDVIARRQATHLIDVAEVSAVPEGFKQDSSSGSLRFILTAAAILIIALFTGIVATFVLLQLYVDEAPKTVVVVTDEKGNAPAAPVAPRDLVEPDAEVTPEPEVAPAKDEQPDGGAVSEDDLEALLLAGDEDDNVDSPGDEDGEELVQENPAAKDSITIVTIPPGAKLKINRQRYGVTPATIPVADIKRFPATIVVQLAGRRVKRKLPKGITGELTIEFDGEPKPRPKAPANDTAPPAPRNESGKPAIGKTPEPPPTKKEEPKPEPKLRVMP